MKSHWQIKKETTLYKKRNEKKFFYTQDRKRVIRLLEKHDLYLYSRMNESMKRKIEKVFMVLGINRVEKCSSISFDFFDLIGRIRIFDHVFLLSSPARFSGKKHWYLFFSPYIKKDMKVSHPLIVSEIPKIYHQNARSFYLDAQSKGGMEEMAIRFVRSIETT